MIENISGEFLDSMIQGLAAYVLVQTLFGKSVSVKGLMSMNTIKEGGKIGAANMVYRTVGRPIVNTALKKGGVDIKV
tara:strand:+ start:2171 stop:2401 length:231 start_codon:yes stop_codon:yes gene_type:complete